MKLILVVLAVLGGTACAAPVRAPVPPLAISTVTTTSAVAVAQRLAPNRRDVPDLQATDEHDAAAVFRAIHPDLVTCLRRAALAGKNAHAYMTADVVLGPDGAVRRVSTTGGAHVGSAAMACIERRIARARFSPPRAGGTLHVSVPFAFDVEEPRDDAVSASRR